VDKVFGTHRIGNLDLADAVADFCLAFPRVLADLTLGGMNPKTYDFIEQGFDVAIHTRNIRNSRIKVKRIATIRFSLCASPAYLEQHRPPAFPRDLLEYACVVQSSDPIRHFGKGKPGSKVKVPRVFSSNSYLVLRSAAIKSLGIALLPYRTVRDDFKDGTLVEILKGQHIPARGTAAGEGTQLHRSPCRLVSQAPFVTV
jgi:DNA-binding transcriptional LysR family regulator